MPTPPPGLTSFSSSYYETHTRTASEPEGDCAWVTDIPETFHGEIYDYWAEVEDWRLHDFDPVQEADKRKDGDAFVTCVRENPDSFPCAAAFWDHVLDVVLRYEPSESGGSDGNRDGNGDGNEQSNGRLAVPEGLGVAMTVAGTLFLGAIAEL